MIPKFCPPLHRDLLLDASGKDSEPEEETTAEQDDTGGKDQPYISMGKNSDAFKDERKDESQQDDPSPEDKLFFPE
jgi:hypothetical protein